MQSRPPALVFDLCRAVAKAGGRALLVGGSVRDGLLGLAPTDWDVEAHGIGLEALRGALRPWVEHAPVGRSFPVFKVQAGGVALDVALPRGPTPGTTDPHAGFARAAERRDFTVNAMGCDPLTAELLDPHGGLDDLRRRVLRRVHPRALADDPVRALRAVQLGARLGFVLHPDVEAGCRVTSLEGVAPERSRGELERILLRAPAPGAALAQARELGLLDQVAPGLGPVAWEPLDRLAVQRPWLPHEGARLAVGWALVVYGSPDRSVPLDALGVAGHQGYPVRRTVAALLDALPAASPTDTELRTAAELASLDLVLRAAWCLGRLDLEAALTRAAVLGVLTGPLPTLLTGEALVALGLRPGPAVGEVLREVRRAQLQGDVGTLEEARSLAVRLADGYRES